MYLIEPIRHGKRITDGAVALAMQVYVQQTIFLDDDILFPYYCDPKVEIGKYQNAIIEVNQDYLKKHNIPVVRRDTGGGAVYVDSGAVNICYLINDNGIFGDFARTYKPAMKALQHLGVSEIKMSGRNDLVINDKKVSGAAMTKVNDRIYGGYSLLLDVDYDAMENVLRPNIKKIESKGIKSVRSRVGNIRDYLSDSYQSVSIEEFKNLIVCQLLDIESINQAKRYELTEEDWQAIDLLAEQKYKNWDWNYGNSPQYSYKRDGRFAAGTVEVQLEIKKGHITNCKFYGDFFGKSDLSQIENALVGTKMKEEVVRNKLQAFDLKDYFGSLKQEELVELLFG
ncbi:lipoyltransferase and lipoate-protein ligase [Streptococcus urinalis FB127-CNA-2]|uniref:lipoate--protein ligase n=1 Tax=Streptococcus urinalis 2285-97 TaxID=764291 RepID=G5KG78_9STRE|nr:lipoate--protein ligase [Streptococcus urinalis]EHJ57475.1 lipoyltransferase and lipoate-protein ligase [Streptococcus urinalis 2285-97]EKS22288.1 lipoyltransferase and lipoate-protein ligase [Streptococcus urinalis FB127-CNA-2]VEF32100.1 lipoate-protein ligase A [Streptococcus urinalis]